jgi:elongation factor 1-alpha
MTEQIKEPDAIMPVEQTKIEAKTDDNVELETMESAKYVVLGSVDAGKSSFIGVMEKDVLDDGNGYARSLVTKIKHEQDTGRTSTHTPHYIIKRNEITTLVDLCGHEKYLKTTMFGVMGLFTDYGIIVIGANMGLGTMTLEHMGLLISNRIPFIIVVTKIDICPANIMVELKKDLHRVARRNKKEIIYLEENHEEHNGSYLKDAHQSIIDSFHERKTSLLPVIFVSNKTGHNIGFVKELITTTRSQSYLERMQMVPPIKKSPEEELYPMVMYIDSTFSVTGIGIVLSGTVKFGPLTLGQKLFVGPVNNTYISITVKSIQNCISENVTMLNENESGSIGIRLETKGSYTREMFSKGQIVTNDMEFALAHTVYTFNCDVAVFNHPTTIKNGYQTVLHAGSIRQCGKFIMESEQLLRSNLRANINVKFMVRPEFLLPGTLFMFRDGRTKGMGKVTKIIPFREDVLEPVTRIRRATRKRSERKKAQTEQSGNIKPARNKQKQLPINV